MKFIASLFLIFVTNSCSPDLTSFIPKDFDYPDNKIGAGKTFVYKNIDSNQYNFKDIRLINDKSYRSIREYDNHSVSDSLITYNGRTIEVYNFFMSGDGTITKGEKLQDTIVKTNDKLGKHLSKWIYRTSQALNTTYSEEAFIKDTNINWQNQPLQCLETQANANVTFQMINNPSVTHNIPVTSKFYYAKGLGLIKFSIAFTDHNGKYINNTWNLINIKDIQ
jgi:hypothetical protein